MPVRTLDPKGGGFGGGPTSIGGRKECQRGRWALKRVDCDVPTLVREENKPPFIRVWKLSLTRRVLRGSESENPNKTIFTGMWAITIIYIYIIFGK